MASSDAFWYIHAMPQTVVISIILSYSTDVRFYVVAHVR